MTPDGHEAKAEWRKQEYALERQRVKPGALSGALPFFVRAKRHVLPEIRNRRKQNMKILNIFSRASKTPVRESKNGTACYNDSAMKLSRGDLLRSITIDQGSCIQTYIAKDSPIEVLSVSHDIVELRLDEARFIAVLESSIIELAMCRD